MGGPLSTLCVNAHWQQSRPKASPRKILPKLMQAPEAKRMVGPPGQITQMGKYYLGGFCGNR